MLLEQLDLMDRRLADVADDIARHDSDKLLANGRFLAEKFAVSSLQLDAADTARAAGHGADATPRRPADATTAPVADASPRRRASTSASGSTDGRRRRRDGAAPGHRAAGLDLAFAWLQRNLDELTELDLAVAWLAAGSRRRRLDRSARRGRHRGASAPASRAAPRRATAAGSGRRRRPASPPAATLGRDAPTAGRRATRRRRCSTRSAAT